jgi:2-oxoglutarate dehydrogenase E2 component (dihydrolipoamide succinyltransferase)
VGPSGAAPPLVDVTMPQMGVSVAEGTVVAWRVAVGDRIETEQTICEISTDKIDTEVPAPASGVVTEILVPVETTVEVGEVLARMAVEGGEAISRRPSDTPDPPPPTDAPESGAAGHTFSTVDAPESFPPVDAPGSFPPVDAPGSFPPVDAPGSFPPVDAPKAGVAEAVATNGGPRRRYSPVVQRIASEHGVDLDQVPGTGRGGRVRKQDVLAFIDAGRAAAPADEPALHIESPYRSEPAPAETAGRLPRIRRQIGEHMKRSLETAAHCTTWIEVDMARIEVARARLGLTALPFVARAAVAALREHPALNAWLEGERYTRHEHVDLGIAVSLGQDGLIVPVIRGAHELSVEGLATRIKELAKRARARELTPDEVRSGTFTITNPGQYGSIMATPIINLPQVAILDLEAVVKHPVVVTDSDGNDSIAIRPTTILGLSWDHRALDGALAAQFLATVKRHLEGWTGA